ncbi:Rop guanine nucleotide exchange factor 3-like protein [Tanacetum coccineum]
MESFQETEFRYVEQGSISSNSRRGSFRKIPQTHRKDEKWWLPVPCLPSEGLSEKARKHLKLKRDSANRIHKEAMAINSSILAEMEIPHTYITSLPKLKATVSFTLTNSTRTQAKIHYKQARGTVEPWLQAMAQKVLSRLQKCYGTKNAMAPYFGGSLVGFKP